MSGNRRWFRVALSASYVNTAVGVATNILAVPILLHYLGNEIFGAWIVATSATAFISLLNLGVAQATANRFAEAVSREEQSECRVVLATGFWLFVRIVAPFFVATVLFTMASLASSGSGAPTAIDMGAVLAAFFLADLPLTVFAACLRTTGHVALQQTIGTAHLCVRLVATYLVLRLGGDVLTLAAVLGVVTLAADGAQYAGLRHLMPYAQIGLGYRSRAVAGLLRRPSAGFLALQAAGMVALSIDAIVIGLILGSGSVTSYAIAQRAVMLAGTLCAAISSVNAPQMLSAYARSDGEALLHVVQRTITLSAIAGAGFAIVLGYFGRDIVALWVGRDATTDALTWYALLLVFLCQVLLYPVDALLVATSAHLGYARWAIVEAVLNVSLSAVLVATIGVAGAAVGTLVGRLLAVGVLYRETSRKHDLPTTSLIHELGRCVPPSLAAVFVGTVSMQLTGNSRELLAIRASLTVGAFLGTTALVSYRRMRVSGAAIS